MCSQSNCYKVIFVVILVLVRNVDCRSTINKFRRTSGVQNAWNHLQSAEKNSTFKEQGRGFFGKPELQRLYRIEHTAILYLSESLRN